MPLIWIALAWMVGIVIGDTYAIEPALTAAIVGLCLLLAAWLALGGKRPRLALALALLAACLLGAWRSEAARPLTSERSIWRWIGAELEIEALVAEEPRWTEREQRLVLRVVAVRRGVGPPQAAEGRLLVVLPSEPPRLPGERLLLSGRLAAPPAGRGFDYAGYLRRRGIYVVLERPAIRRAAPPPASPRSALVALKSQAHQTILRLLPEPEAALLSGILLGLQSALPPEVYEDFNRTGTSHILVISGWNISITIAAMLWLAGKARLRRWPATLLALGAVVLYVLLVGPTAAVVRSAIMGAVVALAAPLHRRSDPWTALAFACMAMSVLDPNVLWDLGFQLSAGAVAGLFACGAALNGWAERLLRPRALRWAAEPLAATFAAQIFTLPLLLYHFGKLSLIAPLANVLLLPAVPPAMALGGLATLVGLILPAAGQALAFLAWLPLAWLARGAHLLAQLPFAITAVPAIPPWLLVLYYLLTIGGLLAWNDRAGRRIIEEQRVAGASPASEGADAQAPVVASTEQEAPAGKVA